MTLILSLLITIIGGIALSFGPQKSFGFELSYTWLIIGRFLIAFGSHGISINGYLLGTSILIYLCQINLNVKFTNFIKQFINLILSNHYSITLSVEI